MGLERDSERDNEPVLARFLECNLHECTLNLRVLSESYDRRAHQLGFDGGERFLRPCLLRGFLARLTRYSSVPAAYGASPAPLEN